VSLWYIALSKKNTLEKSATDLAAISISRNKILQYTVTKKAEGGGIFPNWKSWESYLAVYSIRVRRRAAN
jgi:hypothetical protein